MKRPFSSFLILILLLNMPVTIFGVDFRVTVPTVLPVNVYSNDIVTVATDNKIINNSFGLLRVKSVELVSQNNWTLVDFEIGFKIREVGLKEFVYMLYFLKLVILDQRYKLKSMKKHDILRAKNDSFPA